MSTPAVNIDDLNPFATRATRPGAIDYIFPDDCDAAQLVDRLRHTLWWGQIVGPHGSGKSTLLEALVPQIESRGRRVVRFTLARGQRRLPLDPTQLLNWDDRTQVIVDGCEQLAWRQRRRLMSSCRGAGSGLLVTAHRSLRLPTLFTTQTTMELAEQIVGRLMIADSRLVTADDVVASFARQQGNMRELLFDLYDLYELRRKEDVHR